MKNIIDSLININEKNLAYLLSVFVDLQNLNKKELLACWLVFQNQIDLNNNKIIADQKLLKKIVFLEKTIVHFFNSLDEVDGLTDKRFFNEILIRDDKIDPLGFSGTFMETLQNKRFIQKQPK